MATTEPKDNLKELLTLAAKAAGYLARAGRVCGLEGRLLHPKGHGLLCDNDLYWNPATDDGDAFRLAVKLSSFDEVGLRLMLPSLDDPFCVVDRFSAEKLGKIEGLDPYAASRMAILKAAAEIGRAMP